MLSKRTRPYDPESLDPNTRLRRNLGDLLSRNEVSASRLGEVINDVNRCAPHVVRDLSDAGRQGGPMRKDNVAGKLRRKFLRKSTWMPDYIANIRVFDPKTKTVKRQNVGQQLIHEIVAVLLKNGFKDKIIGKENIDPRTLEHLLFCESEAGCNLLGVGLWGDGAPTQWDRSESIDVLSVSFPGIGGFENLRIPLVALPHSRVCSETWEDVFSIIKWSLEILASGRWPTARHDGSAWHSSDNCRKTARKILRGALVEVRQDWKFASEVFGFPAHNTGDGCCWACKCTPRQVYVWGTDIHTCALFRSSVDTPPPAVTIFLQTYTQYIICIIHNAWSLLCMPGALHTPRHICFLQCICMPCSQVREVTSEARWRNEGLSNAECLLKIMQRKGRLNPILTAPWVKTRIFRMDWLHIGDLGVAADFVGNFLHEVLDRFPGDNKKEKCASLYSEMEAYYNENNVQDRYDCMLPTFFEGKDKPYKLRGSAAKIRALVPFIWQLAQEILDVRVPKEAAMRQAALHLNEVYSALSSEHADPCTAMREHGIKFAIQYVALHDLLNSDDDKAWRLKPKLHLFLHVTSDRSLPRLYWTYRDEDFGGSVARMARRRGGVLCCRGTSLQVLNRFKIGNPVIRIR